MVATRSTDQADAEKDALFRAVTVQLDALSLILSTSYTSSVSLLKIKGCKRDWERMKYVLKPGPDQERHVLNNYLINSSCVASLCHPSDFLAQVVTNHDLCSSNDCSKNCSVASLLFVMSMGPEHLKDKASLKD